MKAAKKPIEQLIAEHHEARPFWNKRFRHKRDGREYQLITTAHDVDTQELQAVFCLSAMTQLKFTRKFSIFLENFEEVKN